MAITVTLKSSLIWNFEASVPIHGKLTLWTFEKFGQRCVILHYTKVRYPLLIFCMIYAKENKAEVNAGHVIVFFTIHSSLKMQFCHFIFLTLRWLL